MKIMIIRHGKVDMEWPKKCTSVEFDAACVKYDVSDIVKMQSDFPNIESGKIYVSPLSRTHNTAKKLFPNEKFFELQDIIEVPLKSIINTDKSRPLWQWNIMERMH